MVRDARNRRFLGFLKALSVTLDTDTATAGLADRLDLPLASLDSDLRRAAGELGVPLLGTGG
jgi:hypothetical protein